MANSCTRSRKRSKSGVHLLFSPAPAFKLFAVECSLFPRSAVQWRLPHFLWNSISGLRVSAFKIGYPVGLAEVLEEGLRTIHERR